MHRKTFTTKRGREFSFVYVLLAAQGYLTRRERERERAICIQAKGEECKRRRSKRREAGKPGSMPTVPEPAAADTAPVWRPASSQQLLSPRYGSLLRLHTHSFLPPLPPSPAETTPSYTAPTAACHVQNRQTRQKPPSSFEDASSSGAKPL